MRGSALPGQPSGTWSGEERQVPGYGQNPPGPRGAIRRALKPVGMFDVGFRRFMNPTEPTSISKRLSKCRGIKLLIYNGPKNAFWQLYCL